jgi:hypothetical protein
MKNIVKISLLAAAIVAAPALSRAQDATTNTAPAVAPAASDQTAPAPVKKRKGLVFKGTVTSLDTNAMTLTVETRTFAITSETKITKDGQPATLSDGVVGEPVAGAYKKADDGTLDATTVHFGAKKKKEAAPAATPN